MPVSGIILATLSLLSLIVAPSLLDALPVVDSSETLCPPAAAGDAPFSLPCSTFTSAVTCPRGIQNKAGGIVFLVHGTGSTGSESWEDGPYNMILPAKAPGFDICWVDLPDRALGDVQVSAEFVAFNVQDLAPKSATGKVSIVGHSQGAGLNPQWALDFYPSTRALVSDYVALAPDFHGTTGGALLCNTGAGCAASIWQQTAGSNYLKAQNSKGNQALVTTTSIFTRMDEVVQPEIGDNPSSDLSGAAVFPLQSLDICGPNHSADHLSMVVDPAAFALAVDALTNDGPASAARFQQSDCTFNGDDAKFSAKFAAVVTSSGTADVAAIVAAEKLRAEPPLKAFVCARGDATSGCEPA